VKKREEGITQREIEVGTGKTEGGKVKISPLQEKIMQEYYGKQRTSIIDKEKA